ncbi:MAG: lamin tail domain-containing protein, partial [Anaerolineales bacterium]
SKRIAAFRKKYREPLWVLSGIGTSLGILYVAVRLAMLWTGSENLPELLGFAIETPTPTMSLTPTTTETRLPTNQPTSTDLPTATLTLTPSPTQIASPAPTQSAQDGPRIAISEIMFVPQPPHGDKDLESWNEYVELFNYGEEPVDVSGWWISDGGVSGTPDKIVSWNERLTGIPVGKAITDSTIIPAGGYALILSTKYDDGDKSYSELIPEKTIILSLADHPDTKSELIGKNGLSASGEFLDVLVLYIGTEIRIETEVSTYGTPIYDEATGPESIRDDGLDAIPRAITTGWGGYQRVYLNAVDTPSNWARFTWDEKTPGYPALDDQTETE